MKPVKMVSVSAGENGALYVVDAEGRLWMLWTEAGKVYRAWRQIPGPGEPGIQTIPMEAM